MSPHPRDIVAATVLLLLLAATPALAQDAMQGMDMSHQQRPSDTTAHKHAARPKSQAAQPQPSRGDEAMPAMAGMGTSGVPEKAPAPAIHAQHAGAMPGTTTPAMPSGPRSADYSDGIGQEMSGHLGMDDDRPFGMLLFDRLEYSEGRDERGAAFDAQAWYGNDENKLWLKMEGETAAGRLQDLRVEALWDRPVSTFWDLQAGVRHDAGIGPDRNWAAFGVQGLAPYWFELAATIYVGPAGRTAFRVESEYELLLTQRLILQPRFEANLYARDDPQRGLGAGLSDAALGLRLRYEFTRQFAPYVGVEFERRFGATARFARAEGAPAFDPRIVAGLRFWF